MVTAVVVSNLGLDSLGVLLAIRGRSPLIGGWRRRSGSSRAAIGVEAIGIGERLKGGEVGIARRWGRRQSVDVGTFRATAADDVEKEEAVKEDQEEAAASSSDKPHQLSSREVSKISRVEQQQQQQQQRQQQQRKQAGPRSPRVFSNFVDEWASREKGDVRDVVLMSLSFAVLVYISQHLVHAYCSLRHMYFNHY